MAINFSAQFIVNEKTSTRVLRLTDTSTGFTLSKGNFIITFPDGSVASNTDFANPQITAPGGNTSVSLITDVDNTVLTGTYVITYVALNTSLNEFTKTETFDFNWEKPTKAIINDSDVVLPEVQFKDLTAYETSGSFTGVLTRNFYTTTPSTSEVGVITKTSAGDILTPSNASKYYEGIYLAKSDISVAYTHTSKSWLTVSYVDLLQETFDVREAPTQDELVALMNTYKDQIEAYKSTNPSQYEIMNEQYDLVLALYSHILARYQTNTLDGSKAILDQLLGLLPPASSYTYKATQMLPFTINFSTALTGTGTTGTLPKFTGTTTLGDSIIRESGGMIGIAKAPTAVLDVSGTIKGTSIVKDGGTSTQFLKADGSVDANSYQPLDGDLTAIAVLAGAAGILTKVSANTWTLDTTSYQVLDADLTAIAALAGTSGFLKKTSANTWELDTTSYQVLDADLTAIAALTGTSGILIKTAANTWSLDTATYQLADADLTAIAALAGTSGLIRKTAANTYELDTSAYLTGITSGQITTALGYTPENAANKGVNNGYAGLDGTGKVPSTQLPSYVDDVLEYANLAALPATGETGKIYVALDTNKVYRWTGSVYVEVSPTVGTIWGGITGTLSNQTDLQNALNAKFDDPTGTISQYIRGDGSLAVLPTGGGGGGGGSVSYYLNGSINQGTIGGVTYYEMNKTPIIGAGTDFSRSSNGYIVSFLTDAGDPALLNIPAGNFNFETYFQASNGGGSPNFYIELYKYDGTTFTLIASNSGTPKLINDGTNIEAYFSALAVPETALTLTDRLAIRIYVNTSGRTITLHTENGHLCQVITTFTTGLTALNGLISQVQYLATGTSGSDFNISSATATHTFNLPTASAANRGALSAADWTTFNNKVSTTQLDLKANILNPVFTDNIYISGTNPRLYFTDTDTNPDYTIFVDSGVFYILNQTTGEARLSIAETGNISSGVGKSMVATSFIKRGGTSSEFLMADGSVSTGAVFNYPAIGIAVSGGGGWLTSIDDNSANWNAAYSARISSLTTTGNSGAATLLSNVLNIPNYTIAGLGGQPAFASGTGFVKISGTTISYDNNTYLPLTGGALSNSLNSNWILTVTNTGTTDAHGLYVNLGSSSTGVPFRVDKGGSLLFNIANSGVATFSGDVTAASFIRTGGTSAGFLKADGSVDIRDYAFASSLANYLPLTGGTIENTLSSGYVLSVKNNGTAADSNGLYVNIDTASTGTPFKVARGGVSLINVNYLGATVLKSTITAISFIKSSGTSSEYLMADGSVSTGPSFTYPGAGIAVSTGTAWGTSITDNSSNWNTAYSSRITSATAPLNITGTTISISQAGASANGFLSSTDWNTFNNKASTASLGNYLPLAGGTLTGPLGGTSASFSSSVTATQGIFSNISSITNGDQSGARLIIANTNGASVNLIAGNPNVDNSGFSIAYGNTNILRFAATSGAATFSSFVTGRSFGINEASLGRGGLYPYNLVAGGGTDYSVGVYSESDVYFASGGSATKKVVLLSGGNVGIGTPSPTELLEVKAANPIFSINQTTQSNDSGIRFKTNDTQIGTITAQGGAGNMNINMGVSAGWGGFINFQTDTTTKMRITSAGNVGIGTETPSSRLSVQAPSNTTSNMDFFSGNNIKGHIGMFSNNFYITSNWFYNGTQNADSLSYGQAAITFDTGTTNGSISFATSVAGSTAPAERLKVTSGGEILINGTYNPYPISTRGNITLNGTGSNIIAFTNNSTPKGYFYHDNTDLEILNVSGMIRFYAANAERMRIMNGGIVRVTGTSSILNFGQLDANNIYFQGYSLDSTAPKGFVWYGLGEYMRITTVGNLLIGAPALDNGYKLQVNGSVSASAYYELSDLRLKNITKKYDSDEFGAIEFGWIDGRDSKNHWGYVAQEVQQYLPDAVNMGNDGFLTVDYNQAHTFKIAKVEDEVTLLKRRVEELEKQLNLN